MSDLHAIVYVSSAVHALGPTEIETILDRARRRNAEYGITGLLLYCDGSFMQYIEGPLEPLTLIYGIILTDPLHHRLIEMVREPIAAREFEGWSMAYRTPDTRTFVELADAAWLDPQRGQDRSDDRPASPGRLLLRRFWSIGARA